MKFLKNKKEKQEICYPYLEKLRELGIDPTAKRTIIINIIDKLSPSNKDLPMKDPYKFSFFHCLLSPKQREITFYHRRWLSCFTNKYEKNNCFHPEKAFLYFLSTKLIPKQIKRMLSNIHRPRLFKHPAVRSYGGAPKGSGNVHFTEKLEIKLCK